MKFEKREIYNKLSELMNCSPCMFCKHSKYEGHGSLCSGDPTGEWYCQHPIDNLSFMKVWEEDVEPGTNCYGFYPKYPLELIIELVSAKLIADSDEWNVIFNNGGFTLLVANYSEAGRKITKIEWRKNAEEI